jgi:hypothetical protein
MAVDKIQYLDRKIVIHGGELLSRLVEGRDAIEQAILRNAKGSGIATNKKMDALAKDIGERYGALQTGLASWAKELAEQDYKDWSAVALKDVGAKWSDSKVANFSRPKAARFYRYDAKQFIAAKTTNMAANQVREIRDLFEEINREGDLKGWTMVDRDRAMKGAMLDAAENGGKQWAFIDSAGKKWTRGNYFNMLNRTVVASVHRQSYMDALAEEGFDLVRIVNAGDPCEFCASWDGTVLSISGAGGLPTLAAASTAGVFHPNCVCHLEYLDATEAQEYIDKTKQRQETGDLKTRESKPEKNKPTGVPERGAA